MCTPLPPLNRELRLRVSATQESVLTPRSFIIHAEEVTKIFQRYRVCHHIFANDKQRTKKAKPSQVIEWRLNSGTACLR